MPCPLPFILCHALLCCTPYYTMPCPLPFMLCQATPCPTLPCCAVLSIPCSRTVAPCPTMLYHGPTLHCSARSPQVQKPSCSIVPAAVLRPALQQKRSHVASASFTNIVDVAERTPEQIRGHAMKQLTWCTDWRQVEVCLSWTLDPRP
jgi:hypothetical protein